MSDCDSDDIPLQAIIDGKSRCYPSANGASTENKNNLISDKNSIARTSPPSNANKTPRETPGTDVHNPERCRKIRRMEWETSTHRGIDQPPARQVNKTSVCVDAAIGNSKKIMSGSDERLHTSVTPTSGTSDDIEPHKQQTRSSPRSNKVQSDHPDHSYVEHHDPDILPELICTTPRRCRKLVSGELADRDSYDGTGRAHESTVDEVCMSEERRTDENNSQSRRGRTILVAQGSDDDDPESSSDEESDTQDLRITAEEEEE